MKNQQLHEGRETEKLLKGTGKQMQEITKSLGFKSYQNLNYHLRKEKLEPNFKRKVEDYLGINLEDSFYKQQMPSNAIPLTGKSGSDIRGNMAVVAQALSDGRPNPITDPMPVVIQYLYNEIDALKAKL
jgi:hypothetical protein